MTAVGGIKIRNHITRMGDERDKLLLCLYMQICVYKNKRILKEKIEWQNLGFFLRIAGWHCPWLYGQLKAGL